MPDLINPHTGQPMKPTRKLTDDDIIRVLQSFRVKIDYLNQQALQLGLYSEFIVNELLKQGVTIDMSQFQEFAEKRFVEIREEVATMVAEREKEIANEALEGVQELQDEVEVRLDE